MNEIQALGEGRTVRWMQLGAMQSQSGSFFSANAALKPQQLVVRRIRDI
jgi:hypothetical protein